MTLMLVGYRGCGKTTIGKRLAGALWFTFVDSDQWIVQQAGKSIAELFSSEGESYFRDLETKAVEHCCGLQDHVIALGGGAVLREQNRAAIRASGAKVIYLKCAPEVLLKRIKDDPQTGTTRPPLTHLGGGMEEIEHLLAEREPLYREIAKLELEVTRLSAEEAAKYLQRLL